MALTGFGLTHRYLNQTEIETILADSLAGMPLDGKRLLVLIPTARAPFRCRCSSPASWPCCRGVCASWIL